MTRLFILFLLALLIESCSQSKKSEQSTLPESNWVYLFDGTGTDHWRGVYLDHFPDSGWVVSEDELMNDGSSKGDLVSREQYANFILEWEWRLFDEGGNSGLKYFVKEKIDENSRSALGLEYQMLDEDNHPWMLEGKMSPNDFHTTGALYEFFEPAPNKKMAPLGTFNSSKIVSNGNHVEHWLNGTKILEYQRGGDEFLEAKAKSKFKDNPGFGLHSEGHLLLQDHSSRVGFKNIRIKKLD